MSDNGLILGQFKLHSFKISTIGDKNNTVDVQHQIVSFNILESMTKGYVSGSFKIVDTNNLVQNFPLKGEEKLAIEYEDWFGIKRTDEFFIYSILHDEMQFKKSDTTQTYTVYFCSIARLLSSTQLVRRGFDDSASNAAEQLFREYIQSVDNISTKPKEIFVKPSSGIQRLVVPSYSPIDALHFLSRNAFLDNGSSAYRFFETREKFWFAPIEYVIIKSEDDHRQDPNKKYKSTFFTSSRPENDMSKVWEKMFQIQGLRYQTRVNTIADMDDGIYKRRVIELDVLSKEVTKMDVDLINDGIQYFEDKVNSKQNPKHGRSFVDNIIAEPYDVFAIKDWSNYASDIRPNPRNKPVMGIKNMMLMNDLSNDIEVLVYGRNNLFAGNIVDLELPMFQERKGASMEIDKERSGKYIIKTINNEFVGLNYYQTLTLTRFGTNETPSEEQFKKIPRITPDEQIENEPYYGAGSSLLPTPNSNYSDATK